MEQLGTENMCNSVWGVDLQTAPPFGNREAASDFPPMDRRDDDEPASSKQAASQELSDALETLLERLPGLTGEDRTHAKKEFLELAAKSGRKPLELVAKTAEVAKRVTGNVKQELEVKRERAEAYVHANPPRAVGIALGAGILIGAVWARSLLRD